MSEIGNRLKKLRLEKGLTTDELAEKMNFAKSIIWSYELGKKEPSFNHIKRIAEFFGVSVDYLTTGEPLECEQLHLDNKRDMENYQLLIDHEEVSAEELKEIIAYIKIKRMMNREVSAS